MHDAAARDGEGDGDEREVALGAGEWQLGELAGSKCQDDSCDKEQQRARDREVKPSCRGAGAELRLLSSAGVDRLVVLFVTFGRSTRQAIIVVDIVELPWRGWQRGGRCLNCLAGRGAVSGEYRLTRRTLCLSSRGLVRHEELPA